jgi:hypothetical protein
MGVSRGAHSIGGSPNRPELLGGLFVSTTRGGGIRTVNYRQLWRQANNVGTLVIVATGACHVPRAALRE